MAAARNAAAKADESALVGKVAEGIAAATGVGAVFSAYKGVLELQGKAEAAVKAGGGNEARQDSARVLPTVAVGQALQKAAPQVADAAATALANLGGPLGALGGAVKDVLATPEGQRTLERYAFATGTLGPVGLAGAVVGDAVSGVIGAVAGKESEKAVRQFVREFDPTASGTVASKVADAAAAVFRSLPFAPKTSNSLRPEEVQNRVEAPRPELYTKPAVPLSAEAKAEIAAEAKKGARAPMRKELL